MRVVLLTTFSASRKEPLSILLERLHGSFLAAGEGEPQIRFAFSDAPLPGYVSSVDRVLKRFPQLERFACSSPVMPGVPSVRQISNGRGTPLAGESVEFATLLSVAAGVPRSFPFHNLSLHLFSPAFGDTPVSSFAGPTMPGVLVGDSWWVNGRNRSLMALTSVDADPAARKLPSPPQSVAAILAACGKAKSTVQVPLPGASAPETPTLAAAANPEVAQAVAAIVRDYRGRLAEILDRAALPHDLPPPLEAMQTGRGETPGPKKPVLVQVFKAMGYDCKGGSGVFTLRRRTPGNLTVEVSLDVGTWSNSLTGSFEVHGLGFTARLPLPPARGALGSMQYSIGGAKRWQQIVENLAALVIEFDRSFVPAVESASGPAPDWYKPEA